MLVALTALLGGCSTLGFYHQSIRGHLALMWMREDIAALVGRSDVRPALRETLSRVLEMREFASLELGLPDNQSYRSYVELDRTFVLWNVVATEEFSLRPRTWCFPVAGCVAYRGYYSQTSAQKFAAGLRGQGHDVFVGGVRAYSTLGWFDDPVFSTMLSEQESYLAAVIFHELAHQRLYVSGDTSFNEAFAVVVEREGVRRWLRRQHDPEAVRRYERSLAREAAFIELAMKFRARLEALYRGRSGVTEKRAGKARILRELRRAYETRKSDIGPEYASWFGAGLNNAKLALVATYHELVPAFERLLAEHDGDLERFYDAAAELGRVPIGTRQQRLRQMLGSPPLAVPWN